MLHYSTKTKNNIRNNENTTLYDQDCCIHWNHKFDYPLEPQVWFEVEVEVELERLLDEDVTLNDDEEQPL